MREIKFRAWDKNNKKIIDLFKITPLALNEGMNNQLAMLGMNALLLPFCKDIVLMQYTGLNDKNGKEIYEGDVVNMRHPDHIELFTGKVVYDIELLAYHLDGPRFYLMINEFDGIEIIGNIYENPEFSGTLEAQNQDSKP